MMLTGRSKQNVSADLERSKTTKGREAVLKSASKKLASNPRDPKALTDVGAIYFMDQSWEKAYKVYQILVELAQSGQGQGQGLNAFEVSFRMGMSALKIGNANEAYRGFNMARTIRPNDFEANYNLGALEFDRKNYERAAQLLQVAAKIDPEHPATLRLLGHSFFRLKKAKEAMAFIRKAIDLAPDDKESLFTLAECYQEANQVEQALRIFAHLRADPVLGPNACLYSGTINMEQHQTDKAIQDFEIGLRHKGMKPEVATDIRYRLATCYLKNNNVGSALPLLKQIRLENSNYKDVSMLIAMYQELTANKNLQTYIMAPSADFVALCRRVVMNYFPKAKVKITNISVNKNEWADILAEVDTPKWQDIVMFRFIRSQGSVGELIVRDFGSHLKDVKAGKGICITIGNFTEEAKRFTEARLIELIERDKFTAMLNTIDTSKPQLRSAAKK
ncbi:tetratricopeptide repeat protein [Breznakiellaceae bacterium SP9]